MRPAGAGATPQAPAVVLHVATLHTASMPAGRVHCVLRVQPRHVVPAPSQEPRWPPGIVQSVDAGDGASRHVPPSQVAIWHGLPAGTEQSAALAHITQLPDGRHTGVALGQPPGVQAVAGPVLDSISALKSADAFTSLPAMYGPLGVTLPERTSACLTWRAVRDGCMLRSARPSAATSGVAMLVPLRTAVAELLTALK